MDFVDLATIAQVGATLAGFAALVSVIQGTIYDTDAIFDVVANGVIALVFALVAIQFGTMPIGLRVLAILLVISSAALVVRDARVVVAAYRDESATYDRTSTLLGYTYLLATAASPLLATAVVVDVWPGESARLYESALLAHVTAAAIMLLDVVRRHTAFGSSPPAD